MENFINVLCNFLNICVAVQGWSDKYFTLAYYILLDRFYHNVW